MLRAAADNRRSHPIADASGWNWIQTGTGEAYGDATFEIEFTIAIVSYGFSVKVGLRQTEDTHPPRAAPPLQRPPETLNLLPGRPALADEPSDTTSVFTNGQTQMPEPSARWIAGLAKLLGRLPLAALDWRE